MTIFVVGATGATAVERVHGGLVDVVLIWEGEIDNGERKREDGYRLLEEDVYRLDTVMP